MKEGEDRGTKEGYDNGMEVREINKRKREGKKNSVYEDENEKKIMNSESARDLYINKSEGLSWIQK